MKRIHLIVTGDVQGVGYRSWARRQARELNLTGFVKNRSDRSVELIAEGAESNLRELAKRSRRGPEVSWVTNVQEEWSEPTGEFLTFSVLY